MLAGRQNRMAWIYCRGGEFSGDWCNSSGDNATAPVKSDCPHGTASESKSLGRFRGIFFCAIRM